MPLPLMQEVAIQEKRIYDIATKFG